MANGEESTTTARAAPPDAVPGRIRRAFTIDEGTRPRRGSPASRFVPEIPSPNVRRRSSNFSDYSISEARKNFRSSTDDLLLPKPSATRQDGESSAWHSTPLAFALLPALGGMLFKNGSSVITDVMLLGLAAIFLNWSVRLPWDWYHSAQAIRKKDEEDNADMMFEDDSEDDNALSFSQTTLDEVPEEPAVEPSSKSTQKASAHASATNELYTHEILALLSCFAFPVLGAYLLHTIRGQLSRPSEGLVSNYNLTIFLLASELRPMAHLAKLIQARTLYLQRVVNDSPYEHTNGKAVGDVQDMLRRVEELEARSTTSEAPPTTEATLSSKQSALLTTEVRRTLQPDLDALNRAVRRYEKRATLQAFQTESRLLDLEARLNDAISLAAAATNNGARNRGFTGIVVEWAATAIVLPVQAMGAIAALPFKTLAALINFGKTRIIGARPPEKSRKAVNGKYTTYGRAGSTSRVAKKG